LQRRLARLHVPWAEQLAGQAGRLHRSPRQSAAHAHEPVSALHTPRPAGAPQSLAHARPQQSVGAEALSGPKPARHAQLPAMHWPFPQQSFGQRRAPPSAPVQPGSQMHRPW